MGGNGAAVRILQEQLRCYADPTVHPDGVFGAKTRDAAVWPRYRTANGQVEC